MISLQGVFLRVEQSLLLLGASPFWGPHTTGVSLKNKRESILYMPTFRNTLSVPSSHLLLKMEQIEFSETSAYINKMPGNHPKENKQHYEQGESLKSKENLIDIRIFDSNLAQY